MYQIETVPVPILDKNKQAHSYTELKIEKPYIELIKEMYITLHSQELKMCKELDMNIMLCKAVLASA